MNLFPIVFLLGFAGLDIAGALIIMSALAMNSSKKQIYGFSLVSLIMTIFVGLLFSKVIGNGVNFVTNIFNSIPNSVYAIMDIIVSIILLIWFGQRVFKKEKYQKKEEKKESFLTKYIQKSLFLVGIIFSLWAMSDPSFWAVVTIASQNNNLLEIIVAFATWMIVGQLPLYMLTIAIIFNKHEKVINFVKNKFINNSQRDKIKKVLQITLSVFLLVAGIYFMAEGSIYLIKGVWIF